MAKVYELYRNQKLGEGSEAQGLERFGGGEGQEVPERSQDAETDTCCVERNWQPDLIR